MDMIKYDLIGLPNILNSLESSGSIISNNFGPCQCVNPGVQTGPANNYDCALNVPSGAPGQTFVGQVAGIVG